VFDAVRDNLDREENKRQPTSKEELKPGELFLKISSGKYK